MGDLILRGELVGPALQIRVCLLTLGFVLFQCVGHLIEVARQNA